MLHLESPSHPAGAATEFALWNLGFRPFYLLASVFAALSVPLWTLEYAPFFAGKFSRFDAPIALAGDVDGESGGCNRSRTASFSTDGRRVCQGTGCVNRTDAGSYADLLKNEAIEARQQGLLGIFV